MDMTYFQLQDFIVHKQFVLQSGLIMFNYLYENGQQEIALELVKRLASHDNSKLSKKELEMLTSMPYNIDSFRKASCTMSDENKKLIKEHWKNNRHHPEFYSDVNNMTEIDIIEMVCDWHARSMQYETDLLEFAKTRQENRFNFPKDMYKKVFNYCKILTACNLKI